MLALVAPSKTIPCYFNAYGNHIVDNVFAGNGFFGNKTNGDLANSAIDYSVNNCFSGNINLNSAQPTSAPANLQSKSVAGTCGARWNGEAQQVSSLFLNAVCDTYGPVLPDCTGLNYPTAATAPNLLPIPREHEMPNPCQGVPSNSWCSARQN